MNVSTLDQVHSNERFAVLSHGTQDDPIFCYFNKAAFLTFLFTEEEAYSTPSRQSAPDGAARQVRQNDIDSSVTENVRHIPVAIRQNKAGDVFEIRDILLWNVYDERGERVGQTAIYDRSKIKPLSKEETGAQEVQR
jgi:hypothetical protein